MLAIGLSSGRIKLHTLDCDDRPVTFDTDSTSGIGVLAFDSDGDHLYAARSDGMFFEFEITS
jgi:hypothetical protein